MSNPSLPPLRSFGDIFGAAWKFFNQRFPTLLGIAAIGLIPQILVNIPMGTEEKLSGPMMISAIIFFLIIIFLAIWMSATMYYYVSQKPDEKNPFHLYQQAIGFVRRIFTTGLLEGLIFLGLGLLIAIPIILLVGVSLASLFSGAPERVLTDNFGAFVIGTILFSLLAFIPVVLLSIRWQFASLLVITENIANFTALRRSAALVKGRWWSVFFRFFLFGLIAFGYVIVTEIITGLFGDNLVSASLQTFLTGILTGPLLICFEVELFTDLRQTSPASPTQLTSQPMVTS